MIDGIEFLTIAMEVPAEALVNITVMEKSSGLITTCVSLHEQY